MAKKKVDTLALYRQFTEIMENHGLLLSDYVHEQLEQVVKSVEDQEVEVDENPTYQVIVTRDTTESCYVEVQAESPQQADDKALEFVRERPHCCKWEINEGNEMNNKPYIGDPGAAEVVTPKKLLVKVHVFQGVCQDVDVFDAEGNPVAFQYEVNDADVQEDDDDEDDEDPDKMTRWVCPKCSAVQEVEAYQLAQVGTPHCHNCEEQEMEPYPQGEPYECQGCETLVATYPQLVKNGPILCKSCALKQVDMLTRQQCIDYMGRISALATNPKLRRYPTMKTVELRLAIYDYIEKADPDDET